MFRTNFADAVRATFSYLPKYGFAEIAADERKVTYSRDDWSLAVFFVPFEYSVSLPIAHSGRRLEIHSFIEAIDPDEFSRTDALNAHNDDELRTSLESLSNRLQKYGARALSGDPAIMEIVASAVEEADARRR